MTEVGWEVDQDPTIWLECLNALKFSAGLLDFFFENFWGSLLLSLDLALWVAHFSELLFELAEGFLELELPLRCCVYCISKSLFILVSVGHSKLGHIQIDIELIGYLSPVKKTFLDLLTAGSKVFLRIELLFDFTSF